ncbi:MAG TPA: hypothetical protein VGI30_11090, partial [Caulobacteraceae bacterium]
MSPLLSAATRGAGTDEYGVEILLQEGLQAVDALALAQGHAQVGDVADLLVDHAFRQAEARDLAADHAARLRVGVDDG